MSKVAPGGNADQAGLSGGRRDKAIRYGRSIIYLGGDVVVGVAGVAVEGIADLYTALEDKKPGDKVRIDYYRGGERRSAELTLSERPASVTLE